MARKARSAETRALAGRLALALGFMVRDPARAARILESHAPEQSAALFAELKTREAAAVLARMTPRHAARHLGTLELDQSTAILKAFGTVDAAATLRCMDGRRRTAILRRLPSRQSVALNWVLGHPETSIGAWTNSDVLALAGDISAQEALKQIQQADSAPGEFVYVVNRGRQLLGLVSVTDLLRAKPDTPIAKLLLPPPTTLQAQASLGSAASLRAWQLRSALPVVDRRQHFVGVLDRSELNRGLEQGELEGAGTTMGDTLLEATEAYWTGLSALWSASFSLLTTARERLEDTRGRNP